MFQPLLLEHGLSFEIAFDGDKKDAKRKMPPKKMESAEHKQTKTTGAEIQEKLDEAEIRRQQVKTCKQTCLLKNGIYVK